MVKLMMNRGENFGLEHYHMPTTDLLQFRPKTTKMVNDKILAFIDKETKSKEWVPAPNKYPIGFDWKNPKDLLKKGHFSKVARVTFTEGILKDPKLKLWPGPPTYKAEKSEFENPGKKASGSVSEKVCSFISDAQYLST